ncbi:unnamed protein product, partial [Cyprideis torosa]
MNRLLLSISLSLLTVTGAQADEEAELIGDIARGEGLFRECSSCHQIGAGAKNRVGPHLNDLFGRSAGSVEGFRYSKSMERASSDGLEWTLDTLNAYIENPRALISGTRMSYRGMKNQQDRNDLLAYLRDQTASPQNIPESAPTARAHE